ncbi:hypothetical protein [Nostoc sp.]
MRDFLTQPNPVAAALMSKMNIPIGLYNCTVYYARQMWLKTGKIVSGFDLTAEMKINKHFNAGYASAMQQTCLNVGEAFKSFKKLLSEANIGKLE